MDSMKKGVVLIVDDEPETVAALIQALENDFDLRVTTEGALAVDLVVSQRPDLVLLDVEMPGLDGYEVCARLKSDDRVADIPIFFLTSRLNDTAEVRGLELGAVDYATKPINPEILRRRITNHIALKQARDRLARLALIDSLTGLANRRFFDQVLETECRHLNRGGRGHLSLVLIDVDYFKAFNDAFGHVVGDHCLKRVAAAIRSVAQRTTDVTARYGGEEFGCILPETPPEGARRLAEEMRQSIRNLCIPHVVPDIGSVVTVSLGVVTLPPGRCSSPTLAITTADSLLYRAKSQGRDRVSATVWVGN